MNISFFATRLQKRCCCITKRFSYWIASTKSINITCLWLLKRKSRFWTRLFMLRCALWKKRNWRIIAFLSNVTKNFIRSWIFLCRRCDFWTKNLIFLLLLLKKLKIRLYIFYIADIWSRTFWSIVTSVSEIERIQKSYEFNFLIISRLSSLYKAIFNIYCTLQLRRTSMKLEKIFNVFIDQLMRIFFVTLFEKLYQRKSNNVKSESIDIYTSTITFSSNRKVNMLLWRRHCVILKTISIMLWEKQLAFVIVNVSSMF